MLWAENDIIAVDGADGEAASGKDIEVKKEAEEEDTVLDISTVVN